MIQMNLSLIHAFWALNKQKPEDMAKTQGIADLINELSPDREDGFLADGSDDGIDWIHQIYC